MAIKFTKRFCVSATTVLAALAAGCTTTPTQTESQRQDAILNDPMGYKPQVDGNVSGGDTGNFDQNAFNKDVKDFFNP